MDYLTLPAREVASLELEPREEVLYQLADGSEAATRLYAGEVEWHGGWKRILIVEMDGGPLLGTAMLHGSHLGMDVVDGGRVEIRSLQDSSAGA